jgi:hypothetical protein
MGVLSRVSHKRVEKGLQPEKTAQCKLIQYHRLTAATENAEKLSANK